MCEAIEITRNSKFCLDLVLNIEFLKLIICLYGIILSSLDTFEISLYIRVVVSVLVSNQLEDRIPIKYWTLLYEII